MSLLDKILGKPLPSSQEEEEKIGVLAGVPILGLDGLSSSAYGPEAALTVLMPLGALGLLYIGPIILAILALLTILYFSYRQTISAYPGGGGSYTVARQNLGVSAGLLAAAALMVDYILNVAVGISAGIGALISAVPSLHPHILPLCLGDADAHNYRQPARLARVRIGVRDSDLCVCHQPDGGVVHWSRQSGSKRRSSGGGCSTARASTRYRSRQPVALAALFCERVYCDDRRGGGQQWGARICQTRGAKMPSEP